MKIFNVVWGFLLFAIGLSIFLGSVLGVSQDYTYNAIGTLFAALLVAWAIRFLLVFFVNRSFWYLLWAVVLAVTGLLIVFGIFDVFEKLGLAGAERYLRMLPIIFISVMLVGYGLRKVIVALFSHPGD